ncbi:MAG: hypothetical protein V1690_02410 [Candidatus Moraniibacteriota bacterium]
MFKKAFLFKKIKTNWLKSTIVLCLLLILLPLSLNLNFGSISQTPTKEVGINLVLQNEVMGLENEIRTGIATRPQTSKEANVA